MCFRYLSSRKPTPAAMPASNTRPTCFDFQVPVDCVNPVEFVDIPESYTLDEDIVVSYRVLKTFRPKSGDWVGLFQCSKTDPDTYVFVTFKWAQKNPEFKEKPLDRRIVFNVEDLNVSSCFLKYYIYISNKIF